MIGCRGLHPHTCKTLLYALPHASLNIMVQRHLEGYKVQLRRNQYPCVATFTSLPHPAIDPEQRRAAILLEVQDQCFLKPALRSLPGALLQDILNDITETLLNDSFFTLR